MKFFPAPEVQKIAEMLIPQHHKHLVGVRIDYVFSEDTPTKGQKEVWGTMRKIGSLPAYLGADEADQERGINDSFFVMTISQPIWENLNTKEKTALTDHELCHATVEITDEGESKLGTVGHDLEEFRAIIERYGLWRPDVQRFVETATNGGMVKTVKCDVHGEIVEDEE